MSRSPIRIVPQEEIAGGLKEPPAFRLPDVATVFAARAARFDAIAAVGAGEPGFLQLMAKLARAQQQALDGHALPLPPDAQHLERCRTHGLPPLGIDMPLDPSWRTALRDIVHALRTAAPPAVQPVLATLEAADAATLDNQASRLLSLDYPALDAALVPFIGAALQLHWVKRAVTLGGEAFKKLDVPNVCPVCGSPPLVSVLRIDVPVPGTRYLHCVLCATEWHMTRGTCSQCEAQDRLAYYHVENDSSSGNDAVRGEACDECKGYIKSLNHEKDPQADPVADDLATLALDILMDESGYERASPNYFFVPGQG